MLDLSICKKCISTQKALTPNQMVWSSGEIDEDGNIHCALNVFLRVNANSPIPSPCMYELEQILICQKP